MRWHIGADTHWEGGETHRKLLWQSGLGTVWQQWEWWQVVQFLDIFWRNCQCDLLMIGCGVREEGCKRNWKDEKLRKTAGGTNRVKILDMWSLRCLFDIQVRCGGGSWIFESVGCERRASRGINLHAYNLPVNSMWSCKENTQWEVEVEESWGTFLMLRSARGEPFHFGFVFWVWSVSETSGLYET